MCERWTPGNIYEAHSIIINLMLCLFPRSQFQRNIWTKFRDEKAPASLRPFCISFSLFCSRNVYSPCIDRSCITYSDTFPFPQTGRRRLFLFRTKCLFTADASVTFFTGTERHRVDGPLFFHHRLPSFSQLFRHFRSIYSLAVCRYPHSLVAICRSLWTFLHRSCHVSPRN